MKLDQIICGDALDVMAGMESESVDMILCDLPYGTTQCSWDTIIPFEPLWKQYKRIIKPNGAIVLTASQPFTSMLVMSNIQWFRHEWIWIKNCGGNFVNTVREPFKEHESVLVFSQGKWTYNKQMQERTGEGLNRIKYKFRVITKTEHYGGQISRVPEWQDELRVPSSWQKFSTEKGLHPTQKPVALFAYLIRTYTNEGEVVLDNCIGSGTTAIAAIRTGRHYIGIEKEQKYCAVAEERIRIERAQLKLDL